MSTNSVHRHLAAIFRRGFLLLALAFLGAAHVAEAATFTYTDLHGQKQSLERYHGKWVLLNLWATWCAPCMREMPVLQALSEDRKDLVVLGLAVDGEGNGRLQEFVDKLHVTYPVIPGNQKMARRFEPRGYPTSILFDPEGQDVLHFEGPVTRQQVEASLVQNP